MATKTKKKPPAKKVARKPKADDGPSWRRMAITEAFDDDFDLPTGVIAVLTNLGVKTCGELADRLLASNTFGLKLIEVQSLCESIETMSSDDERPVKFNEGRDVPASITCPACGSDAPHVEATEDGDEYGCSKVGCGWLGTRELAETHRKNLATKAGWMGEPAKPGETNAAPFTPEELAAYDAETCVLIREAETLTATAESRYLDSKERASADKKAYEVKVLFLRKLICDRAENRGKRPKVETPTLLDVLPKWKSLPLTAIEMRPELLVELTKEDFTDLSDLDNLLNDGDWTEADSEQWKIALDEVAELREKLKAIIEKETPAQPVESDLYKQYPIERWTRFGLTAKDVEKLHAGETKGTATGLPIITMGDLQKFITPNTANPGYVQSVTDIKGIGDAGATRIEEAQMQFWAWWRAGGEVEFAAEVAPKPVEAAA